MRLLLTLLALTTLLSAEEISFQGRKLSYISKGSGPNPIMMIHGWACDHTFLDAQTDEFSKAHRVLALDLPGHGQSEAPAPLTIDAMVAAVEAVRAAAKVNQLTLVGHSMGAIVVREYAKLYPARTKAVIFLDGSIFQLPPGAADRARWAEGINRMAQTFGPANAKQVRERNVSVFLSNLYPDDTSRELRMSILRKMLATSPETAQAAMAAMTDLKLWGDDKLNVPALALRAGRQQPPNEEVYLKSIFPNLEYKFMPGMSHFLMMEHPAKVNQEIRTFLKASKLE